MSPILLLNHKPFCAPQVRSKAQNVLFTALGTYNFCCRDITPRVLELLKPKRTDVTQQQFKVNISLLFSYILAFVMLLYLLYRFLFSPVGSAVLLAREPWWSVHCQPTWLGLHRSDVARHSALWPQLSYVFGETIHRQAVRWPRWQGPPPVRDHRHRFHCEKLSLFRHFRCELNAI